MYGWIGVLTGAGVIFYAFIGFDAVTTAAQEVKDPKRDIPVGILGSLLVCIVLYIAVSLVLTGVVNYRELNVPAPVAFAVQKAGPALAWIKPLIKPNVRLSRVQCARAHLMRVNLHVRFEEGEGHSAQAWYAALRHSRGNPDTGYAET
jgi:L-asparagine transporter-like permease